MGHRKGKAKRPRRGSMQYWPRVRARRIFPRVKSWPNTDETKLLGFGGYKAGMTHITYIDTKKTSPTYNQEVTIPVTVIETPPLRVLGLRFITKTPYGKKVLKDVLVQDISKYVSRTLNLPKKQKDFNKELESINMDDVSDIHLLVYTQPHLINLKKKPEVFEIAIGGDKEKALEYAKELVKKKEIKVQDVIKPGEQIDILAVTKGKGTQGSIKRFGVKLESKKSDRPRRRVATLGPEGQAKVMHTVPQFGQMGFHSRCDYNKWVLMVGSDDITPDGGFVNYGVLHGDYIVVKGSIPGPKKRFVRIRHAIRPNPKIPNQVPDIKYIHRGSQQ